MPYQAIVAECGLVGVIRKAHALHEAAHKLCFIANSVNFPVACEPVIVTA